MVSGLVQVFAGERNKPARYNYNKLQVLLSMLKLELRST